MKSDKKIYYYDERTLLIVTGSGQLKQLIVPFQVRCIKSISVLQEGTLVYVEAITTDKQYLMLYRILNQWIPYNYFILVIKF